MLPPCPGMLSVNGLGVSAPILSINKVRFNKYTYWYHRQSTWCLVASWIPCQSCFLLCWSLSEPIGHHHDSAFDFDPSISSSLWQCSTTVPQTCYSYASMSASSWTTIALSGRTQTLGHSVGHGSCSFATLKGCCYSLLCFETAVFPGKAGSWSRLTGLKPGWLGRWIDLCHRYQGWIADSRGAAQGTRAYHLKTFVVKTYFLQAFFATLYFADTLHVHSMTWTCYSLEPEYFLLYTLPSRRHYQGSSSAFPTFSLLYF